jgi:predicted NAD-dependent protein-ADP-ribosyltransferase YbiA (DUF1768 family)
VVSERGLRLSGYPQASVERVFEKKKAPAAKNKGILKAITENSSRMGTKALGTRRKEA